MVKSEVLVFILKEGAALLDGKVLMIFPHTSMNVLFVVV